MTATKKVKVLLNAAEVILEVIKATNQSLNNAKGSSGPKAAVFDVEFGEGHTAFEDMGNGFCPFNPNLIVCQPDRL